MSCLNKCHSCWNNINNKPAFANGISKQLNDIMKPTSIVGQLSCGGDQKNNYNRC